MRLSRFAFAALLSLPLMADTASEIATLKARIAALEAKTDVLVEETANLQTGFTATTLDPNSSYSGLSAAASKVYYATSPLSIGGYGEMYHATQSNGDSKVDVYRFVPYIGYKFSDRIILNTELEFEHGGVNHDGDGGEVILEFMTLDFLINAHANLRVGHMLVPMGLINERHEPNLFTTVQRPDTAKNLIPTTWHESGAMVYGDITEGWEYKIALITALKPEGSGSKWIRNGRGGSFTQNNPNAAGVIRLDYTAAQGLLAGASAYYGAAGDGSDATLGIADIHADWHYRGLRMYGTYAMALRSEESDAADYRSDNVKEARSYYVNASFDPLSLAATLYRAPIFIQYENMEMEAERFDGSSGDGVATTTVGMNFFPHDQVVLKADYAMVDNGQTESYIASFGLGFIF